MKVSVVVNCCYEGLLLDRALASVFRSVDASGIGEACEVILVADAADESTARVVARHERRVNQVVRTGFGDLGQARNAGVTASRGELVLFIDGDDLWGSSWVGAAWREYQAAPPLTVLHPRLCAFFGARSELLVHPDWREPDFDPRGLVARNYWTSPCGVGRALLAEHSYPRTNVAHGLGFEDWSWHAQTVAAGFRHVAVPGTIHFIRLKAGPSMQRASFGCLPVPSAAFADYLAGDDPTRPFDL